MGYSLSKHAALSRVPLCKKGYHHVHPSYFYPVCEENANGTHYDDSTRWKREIAEAVTSAASNGVLVDLRTVVVIAACLGAYLAIHSFEDVVTERLVGTRPGGVDREEVTEA